MDAFALLSLLEYNRNMRRILPILLTATIILTSCMTISESDTQSNVYSFKIMNIALELWEKGDEMLLTIPEQNAYFLPLVKEGESYYSKSTGIKLTPGNTTILYEQNGYQERAALTELSKDGEAYYQRPQDPLTISYIQKEVTIPVEGGVLSGELDMLDESKERKAVIFITGSGSQNRDEEISNHHPFLIISDYLVKQGYTTLRCDDRGAGGSVPLNGSETTYTFCEDVKAEAEYLRSLGYEDIILLGHSEGAMIAAIVENEINPSAMVLIGCPAAKGIDIILDQNRTNLKIAGVSDEMITQLLPVLKASFEALLSDKIEEAQKLLASILGEEYAKAQLEAMNTPWYRTFLSIDTASYLRKNTTPTLVIQGSHDMQVRAELNEKILLAALEESGCTYTYKYLEGINHMMQNSTTGNTSEYGLIMETVNERVLEEISSFLGGVN